MDRNSKEINPDDAGIKQMIAEIIKLVIMPYLLIINLLVCFNLDSNLAGMHPKE